MFHCRTIPTLEISGSQAIPHTPHNTAIENCKLMRLLFNDVLFDRIFMFIAICQTQTKIQIPSHQTACPTQETRSLTPYHRTTKTTWIAIGYHRHIWRHRWCRVQEWIQCQHQHRWRNLSWIRINLTCSSCSQCQWKIHHIYK